MIARQAAIISKRTMTPLSRRMFNTTRTVTEEGGNTQKLTEKERAAEKQWVRQHVSFLLF